MTSTGLMVSTHARMLRVGLRLQQQVMDDMLYNMMTGRTRPSPEFTKMYRLERKRAKAARRRERA